MNLNYDELLQRIDIVKVVSHYLEVTKRGSNYEAVCPFHNDTRPSLKISPSKQIFNCFVCHTGGNAYTFIQKYENVSFIEAVKKACDICGIENDIKVVEDREYSSNKNCFLALDDASKYYELYLKTNNGKVGLDYLTSRGIDEETITKFRLGYAPKDGKLLIENLRKKGHDIETLKRAGILSDSVNFTDRYHNRIMFPISDDVGRIRGFSGRILEKTSDNKYVNYPETILFKKNDLLFNLHNAKPLAKKSGYLYIVEGFMDAIALQRIDYPVVATMGTALTDNHINRLKKLNVEIRMLLDSDKAGQSATIASAKNLSRFGITFKIVKNFVNAKDPDELLTRFGKEELITALTQIEEPILHFLNLYKDNELLKTYEQKEEFLNEFSFLLNNQSELVKNRLIEDIAGVLGFSSESIQKYCDTHRENIKKVVKNEEIDEEVLDLTSYLVRVLKQEKKIFKLNNSLIYSEAKLINILRTKRSYYNIFHSKNAVFNSDILNDVLTLIGEVYTENVEKEKIDNEDLKEILNKIDNNDWKNKKNIKGVVLGLMRSDEDANFNESEFCVYLMNHDRDSKKAKSIIKGQELN